MAFIDDTIYPQIIKYDHALSTQQFDSLLTPTEEELLWVKQSVRSIEHRAGFLIQLRLFGKLGYFPRYSDLIPAVFESLTRINSNFIGRRRLKNYFESRAAQRHQTDILKQLTVFAWSNQSDHQPLSNWLIEETYAKDRIEDVINAAIEYLLKNRKELPPFKTLVRICESVKTVINEKIFASLAEQLSFQQKRSINQLFELADYDSTTPWFDLKSEPGGVIPKEIKKFVDKVKSRRDSFEGLPGIQK